MGAAHPVRGAEGARQAGMGDRQDSVQVPERNSNNLVNILNLFIDIFSP